MAKRDCLPLPMALSIFLYSSGSGLDRISSLPVMALEKLGRILNFGIRYLSLLLRDNLSFMDYLMATFFASAFFYELVYYTDSLLP